MASFTNPLSRTQTAAVQSCRKPSPPPTRVACVAHKALSAPIKQDPPPVTAHASSSSHLVTRIESAAAGSLPAPDRTQRAADGFPKRDPSPHGK